MLNSYKSPELDAIRQRIDALDNNVHDLLMERADLVMRISEEKKRNGIQIVQPAREARMIRRLIARHRAPLPEETIVRIWRELVGSISLLQTGLSVTVATDQAEYWDMARDYFGAVLPMQKNSTDDAIQLVLNDKITFAVVPWPSLDQTWWTGLIENKSLKIIQRLPFGDKENYAYNDYPCLVVAKAGFDTSDDDRSFVAVKKGDLEQARAIGPVLNSYEANGFVMLEIDAYIGAGDERLTQYNAVALGGYPTPLSYR